MDLEIVVVECFEVQSLVLLVWIESDLSDYDDVNEECVIVVVEMFNFVFLEEIIVFWFSDDFVKLQM